jgi:uncharacterized damage-inducible protein DinB
VRTDPDPAGSETELLTQYLDYQRETILLKTAGLTREQLGQPHPPSNLSLGGLLNHLALVEDTWGQVRFLGLPDRPPWADVDWDADPDWEFRTAGELTPEELRVRYSEACDRTRELVARASVEQISARPWRDGRHFSLRWMLMHLIEETARHAGHADLLREAVDGEVGE